MALTNSTNQQHFKVTYHPFTEGEIVCNIFWPTSDCQTVSGGVDIYLNNGESKIYVPKSMLAVSNDEETDYQNLEVDYSDFDAFAFDSINHLQ